MGTGLHFPCQRWPPGAPARPLPCGNGGKTRPVFFLHCRQFPPFPPLPSVSSISSIAASFLHCRHCRQRRAVRGPSHRRRLGADHDRRGERSKITYRLARRGRRGRRPPRGWWPSGLATKLLGPRAMRRSAAPAHPGWYPSGHGVSAQGKPKTGRRATFISFSPKMPFLPLGENEGGPSFSGGDQVVTAFSVVGWRQGRGLGKRGECRVSR